MQTRKTGMQGLGAFDISSVGGKSELTDAVHDFRGYGVGFGFGLGEIEGRKRKRKGKKGGGRRRKEKEEKKKGKRPTTS